MERSSEGETDDADREVSRRVENPTKATQEDAATYEAADPAPDGDRQQTGPADADGTDGPEATDGESNRAAAELRSTDESEPTRSE